MGITALHVKPKQSYSVSSAVWDHTVGNFTCWLRLLLSQS